MSQPVISRLGVFASGRGTNFQALVDAANAGKLSATLSLLVCDRPDAPVIALAEKAKIPFVVILEKDRDAFEVSAIQALERHGVELGVLAGFKRILGPKLLGFFKRTDPDYHRIVNIHPSLLPAFPGLHSYRQAFDYGCKVAGVTVHWVDEKLDHGPICAQESFRIEALQTAEAVEAAGLKIEHRLYPEVLNWLCTGNFKFEGRTCVRTN